MLSLICPPKSLQVLALQSFLTKILHAVCSPYDADAIQVALNIPHFHGTCSSYKSRSFLMDMPCRAAVSKIRGILEKDSVIDVREAGSDVNWFKQLKVTFSALQVLL